MSLIIKKNIWINFGIVNINEKIGNIFLIDKIVDNETKKKYPFILDNCRLKQKSCITHHKPNYSYTDDLSDMEASGFFLG